MITETPLEVEKADTVHPPLPKRGLYKYAYGSSPCACRRCIRPAAVVEVDPELCFICKKNGCEKDPNAFVTDYINFSSDDEWDA